MFTNVKSLLLIISAVIMLSACSTLNPKEIQSLNREAFSPLELTPSVEPTDLRLDVIRQVQTTHYGNSVQATEVPNDPLGFDLGNGLFYDLNENFSLRLDKLLGYTSNQPFALKKMENPAPERGTKTYTFQNDSLTTSFSERNRSRYVYHRTGPADSLSYMNGAAPEYVIVRRDSALVCRNRRKVKKELVSLGDGNFSLKRGSRDFDFEQKNNQVDLQSHYQVVLSDANKTMTIYRLYRTGRRTSLYTLIRSRDALYVFNENFKGQKIVFENGGISVFRNKNLVVMYNLALPESTIDSHASAMR